MDFATHLLVPYAGALLALRAWRADAPRARVAWAAVFGVAGFAPDLDGLFDWMSDWQEGLYFLQHRGVSHTLWGAPLFAFAALGALCGLARVWPKRFGLFAYRPALLGAAAAGSMTHLVLDGVTYGGVPLLWPLVEGRFLVMHFHWLVFWMLPLSLAPLALHAFGRLSRGKVAVCGVLVVLLLAAVGGLRLATRPDTPEGGHVYPRSSEFAWTVLEPVPDGWRAYVWRDGNRSQEQVFLGARTPGDEDAVAAARATDAYRGFRMGAFGPQLVRTEATPAGWNVTFLDAAQRFEALSGARWTPTHEPEDWGYVAFAVDGTKVRTLHRGY